MALFALLPLGDFLIQRRVLTDGVHKVLDVNLVAHRPGAAGNLDAFQIVDFVAGTVLGEAAVVAVKCDERQLLIPPWIATAVIKRCARFTKIENRHRRVRCLLIVGEMISSASVADANRVIDAETPAPARTSASME